MTDFRDPPTMPLFIFVWLLTIMAVLHAWHPRAETVERPEVLW